MRIARDYVFACYWYACAREDIASVCGAMRFFLFFCRYSPGGLVFIPTLIIKNLDLKLP